jgi:hypothetical protein
MTHQRCVYVCACSPVVRILPNWLILLPRVLCRNSFRYRRYTHMEMGSLWLDVNMLFVSVSIDLSVCLSLRPQLTTLSRHRVTTIPISALVTLRWLSQG